MTTESSQERDLARVTMGVAHDAAKACTQPWYSRVGFDFQRGRLNPADGRLSRFSALSNSEHFRAYQRRAIVRASSIQERHALMDS
jgi:hypothetical protein